MSLSSQNGFEHQVPTNFCSLTPVCVLFFYPKERLLYPKLTCLDPVTLADDDALLRVGDVHAIVLDRYNVGPSPKNARTLLTLGIGKRDVAVKNAPRVAKVEGDRRRPRRGSGRLPDADVRLLGHHVEVQDDVAVALLVAICTKMKLDHGTPYSTSTSPLPLSACRKFTQPPLLSSSSMPTFAPHPLNVDVLNGWPFHKKNSACSSQTDLRLRGRPWGRRRGRC